MRAMCLYLGSFQYKSDVLRLPQNLKKLQDNNKVLDF